VLQSSRQKHYAERNKRDSLENAQRTWLKSQAVLRVKRIGEHRRACDGTAEIDHATQTHF
jgi:hypothetical protein